MEKMFNLEQEKKRYSRNTIILSKLEKKIKNNEELTQEEKMQKMIWGRDTIKTNIGEYECDPSCAYRVVKDINFDNEFIDSHNSDEFIKGENNAGIDWYLGGYAPKYATKYQKSNEFYIIETPAYEDMFHMKENENTKYFMGGATFRHLKSSGFDNPIKLSNCRVLKVNLDENSFEIVQNSSA